MDYLKYECICTLVVRLSDVFNLTVSYGNLYNLEIGLSLKGGPFQIYVLSDNLLIPINLLQIHMS